MRSAVASIRGELKSSCEEFLSGLALRTPVRRGIAGQMESSESIAPEGIWQDMMAVQSFGKALCYEF